MFEQIDQFKNRTALITQDGLSINYGELIKQADDFCLSVINELPSGISRPLILIETRNSFQPISAYLGAMRKGWPVILMAEGAINSDSRIVDNFQPNYIFRPNSSGWSGAVFSTNPASMHSDLRLLLSTSGTTGAPKLVRLSDRNISENAKSIIEYLGIQPEHKAITALPFHYSYGLSVLNSHLAVGACMLLTDSSVVDNEFWTIFEKFNATSVALVPFQFDLLEKNGMLNRRWPSLRYVTQAGGKLAETAVLRFAETGERHGWKLYVMYGQTEASPRMAYVPPDMLQTYPNCIGIPVPGGSFKLLATDGSNITETGKAGELVYEGPNVMLGYAEFRDDLAHPAGPEQLKTGDIAERLENGFYRVVGRIKRFIKLFGLRISLDEIEEFLRSGGYDAYCAGTDEQLSIFTIKNGTSDTSSIIRRLTENYKLPAHVIAVHYIDAIPLLASGKVNYKELQDLAEASIKYTRENKSSESNLETKLKLALRCQTLDLDRSFTDLGGDSLSYLEVQLCLEKKLGSAPMRWEYLPLGELLAFQAGSSNANVQFVRTDLILRILSLFGVITLHATDLPVSGGVYLLVVLIGYSLARFQSKMLIENRISHFLRTMLQPILIGYFVILSVCHIFWKPVDTEWFLLLGNYDTQIRPRGIQPYWFVCLYVQIMLLIGIAFTFKPIRVSLSKSPFYLPAAFLCFLMLTCVILDLQRTISFPLIRHPIFAIQLILIGWLMFMATSLKKRLVTSMILAINIIAFWNFHISVLIALITGGLLLQWSQGINLPSYLSNFFTITGKNTLFIYLVHPPIIMAFTKIIPHGIVFFSFVILATVISSHIAKAAYEASIQELNKLLQLLRQ